MSDHILGVSVTALSVTERVLPVTVLGLLGLFLLFGAGFAQPDVLHAAAHDGRHAFSFPCH